MSCCLFLYQIFRVRIYMVKIFVWNNVPALNSGPGSELPPMSCVPFHPNRRQAPSPPFLRHMSKVTPM